MRRTNVVRLLPTKSQAQVLHVLGDRSAALYKAVQYRCRQALFSGEAVPSEFSLIRESRDHPAYRALPAHIGQEVIKKARKAWDAYFACRRLHRTGKLEQPPHARGTGRIGGRDDARSSSFP